MLDTPMFQQISKITYNFQQNVLLLDHLLSSCLESTHVTQVSVGGYNPAKTKSRTKNKGVMNIKGSYPLYMNLKFTREGLRNIPHAIILQLVYCLLLFQAI